MKQRNRGFILVFAGLAIAVNIILGTIVDIINIPLLFLDTIGTIFTAAVFGPWYGALTGGLTNVIQGIITNPRTIPFAFVNIAVGIVVGLISRKWKFNFVTAIFTGLILSIVAPLIGSPIAIYLYDGLTGDFNDVFYTLMMRTGQRVFTSAFIPRVASNIVDKVVSCLLVAFLIQRLPKQYTERAK